MLALKWLPNFITHFVHHDVSFATDEKPTVCWWLWWWWWFILALCTHWQIAKVKQQSKKRAANDKWQQLERINFPYPVIRLDLSSLLHSPGHFLFQFFLRGVIPMFTLK